MKIIASDFDGTFCREGGIIQSDLDAVKKWREAGNLFGFSTGRCFGSISKKVKDMEVDFFVCSGGAAVYNGNGELMWENAYSVDLLIDALEIIADYDTPYIDVTYDKKEWNLIDRYQKNPFPENIKKIHHTGISCVSQEMARELSRVLTEEFDGRATGQYNYMNVDLVSPGVTKTTGIRELLKITGVKEEDVITIGDQLNDYEMIRDFNGCAVVNAYEPVKAIARKLYANFTDLVNDHI